MAGVPNEERPLPAVPDSYVPPSGVRHPLANGETWISVATGLGIDPWDLIDFNFPGTKALKNTNPERASRQVNWYLREYVGCQSSSDGQNWAFAGGLTKGRGSWRGGIIFVPPKKQPPPPPPAPTPVHQCTPTSSGKLGRRPNYYRLLSPTEEAMVRKVFGHTLPYFDQIGIGDGLGFDGRPWTDASPMSAAGLLVQLQYQINLGDAMHHDLTGSGACNCYVTGCTGSMAELLVHEMTHVWQYHARRSSMVGRESVWISSVAGSYNFKPGGTWDSYDVEQQASIVEAWYHNGALPTDPLYPYIRLVIQSAGGDGAALDFASARAYADLVSDLADMQRRGIQ